MKTFIKAYLLPSLFLVALTTQVSAQSTRSAKVNTTVNSKVSSKIVTYKTPTRKVVSVRELPKKTVVNHKGQNYYYANNQYYTQSSGRYIAIAPKAGFRVKVLPTNFKKVRFNNYNYYTANGVYYVQVDSQYEVVEPEVGTIVYELPVDYEKVVVNNETFYEYANILYEKIQVDGTRAYKVVGMIEIED